VHLFTDISKDDLILDSRFAQVYDKGSIPDSLNIPFTEVLNEDRSFRSAEELELIFKEYGLDDPKNQKAVMSCMAGITACTLDVALR